MFKNCKKLEKIDIPNTFKTSSVTNLGYMFAGCESLTSLNLESFTTSKVITMTKMFYGDSELRYLDISNFVTSSVKNYDLMFEGTTNLTLKIDLYKSSEIKKVIPDHPNYEK